MQNELNRAKLHPDVLRNLAKNKQLKKTEAYSEDNPPPYPVTSVNGQTGAVGLDASDVGALRLIIPANLADYGLPVSGTVYNFTLSQLFSAIPGYSYVSIPWIKAQDTTAFGTLAGELPTGTTDYGMLTLEKSASIGEFRFIRYSSSNVFHGSFTTVNSRGFNGWVEDKT